MTDFTVEDWQDTRPEQPLTVQAMAMQKKTTVPVLAAFYLEILRDAHLEAVGLGAFLTGGETLGLGGRIDDNMQFNTETGLQDTVAAYSVPTESRQTTALIDGALAQVAPDIGLTHQELVSLLVNQFNVRPSELAYAWDIPTYPVMRDGQRQPESEPEFYTGNPLDPASITDYMQHSAYRPNNWATIRQGKNISGDTRWAGQMTAAPYKVPVATDPQTRGDQGPRYEHTNPFMANRTEGWAIELAAMAVFGPTGIGVMRSGGSRFLSLLAKDLKGMLPPSVIRSFENAAIAIRPKPKPRPLDPLEEIGPDANPTVVRNSEGELENYLPIPEGPSGTPEARDTFLYPEDEIPGPVDFEGWTRLWDRMNLAEQSVVGDAYRAAYPDEGFTVPPASMLRWYEMRDRHFLGPIPDKLGGPSGTTSYTRRERMRELGIPEEALDEVLEQWLKDHPDLEAADFWDETMEGPPASGFFDQDAESPDISQIWGQVDGIGPSPEASGIDDFWPNWRSRTADPSAGPEGRGGFGAPPRRPPGAGRGGTGFPDEPFGPQPHPRDDRFDTFLDPPDDTVVAGWPSDVDTQIELEDLLEFRAELRGRLNDAEANLPQAPLLIPELTDALRSTETRILDIMKMAAWEKYFPPPRQSFMDAIKGLGRGLGESVGGQHGRAEQAAAAIQIAGAGAVVGGGAFRMFPEEIMKVVGGIADRADSWWSWIKDYPDHLDWIMRSTTAALDGMERAGRSTGNEVVDFLSEGFRGQSDGLLKELGGGAVPMVGGERTDLLPTTSKDLSQQGYNGRAIFPNDIRKEMEAGDAMVVGYRTEQDYERAVEQAGQYGLEVDRHFWRKPTRRNVRPAEGQEWTRDHLKKLATTDFFYPDAGLRRGPR